MRFFNVTNISLGCSLWPSRSLTLRLLSGAPNASTQRRLLGKCRSHDKNTRNLPGRMSRRLLWPIVRIAPLYCDLVPPTHQNYVKQLTGHGPRSSKVSNCPKRRPFHDRVRFGQQAESSSAKSSDDLVFGRGQPTQRQFLFYKNDLRDVWSFPAIGRGSAAAQSLLPFLRATFSPATSGPLAFRLALNIK